MNMEELEIELDLMVHALKLNNKKTTLGRNVAVQYVVDDFGVVLCGIDRPDYKFVSETLSNRFEGYRFIYITTNDNMFEKKDEVVWDLMRSGYMKWIRTTYPREFKNLIVMGDYGSKIIRERLRLWADQPKYGFFIQDNLGAKQVPTNYILAHDSSFFDYMP